MIKTVVITTPHFFDKETDYCNQLFDNGLEVLHLRKPDADADLLRHFIKAIDVNYRNRIVLHSHYDLVDKWNLKGIHLTSKTKSMFDDSNTYQHISASCHSFLEIDDIKMTLNYCFLSPIFNSISKKGYNSAFDLSEIKSYLKETRQNIYALGGIAEKNISTAIEIGFKGVALLGYIWEDEKQVIKRFKTIQKIITQSKES